jgi:hypothetical protein
VKAAKGKVFNTGSNLRGAIKNLKNIGMKSKNTFGVHFFLRTSRLDENGRFPICARIEVNQTRTEFSVKHSLPKSEWSFGKGEAKPKNDELKEFNTYLQELQGKLARQFRDLQFETPDCPLTATAVKNAFLGITEEKSEYTLMLEKTLILTH